MKRRSEADPDASADIASAVHGTFATALRMPVDQVAEVDRLEALGCDSLRIVEITVALSEKFPVAAGHAAVRASLGQRNRARDCPTFEPERARRRLLREPAAAHARRRHPARQATGASDIAVVGMHVRCAGADSPDELWDLLSRRRSCREASAAGPAALPASAHRYSAALGRSARRGGAIRCRVLWRLAARSGVHGSAAAAVPRSGVERARGRGLRRRRSRAGHGCVRRRDVRRLRFPREPRSKSSENPYRCWEGFSLANRLSQLLGFHGPSLAVDTACSSSGTALHLACAALRAGECRVAVVGGVNLILDPDRFGSLGRLGILSTSGKCEPFGADADGTVLGEGAGVVVLRPLDEALRRGDRIYGVIKGTGLSTGSGTVGFTAPNPQAQAEAIRRSLRTAGVDPRTISYVETHGTGTALGDPIEVRGLTLGYASRGSAGLRVGDRSPLPLGSIKPNIGHLEAGAGVWA